MSCVVDPHRFNRIDLEVLSVGDEFSSQTVALAICSSRLGHCSTNLADYSSCASENGEVRLRRDRNSTQSELLRLHHHGKHRCLPVLSSMALIDPLESWLCWSIGATR